MSDTTGRLVPKAIDNQHLGHLLETRAGDVKIRDDADKKARATNAQIMELMVGAGVNRHQLPNGTIVSIVTQPDRLAIVAERLLGHGVSPAIIEDATKKTPVAPFIRVDKPGAKTEAGDATAAATLAANVDQPGTISDQRPN